MEKTEQTQTTKEAKNKWAFLERMKAEWVELEARSLKAMDAVKDDKLWVGEGLNKDLLASQVGAMLAYLEILRVRIRLAEAKKSREEGEQ